MTPLAERLTRGPDRLKARRLLMHIGYPREKLRNEGGSDGALAGTDFRSDHRDGGSLV